MSNHAGFTASQLATIQRMAAEGKTAREIARVVNCAPSSVYGRCYQHGWKLTKPPVHNKWPEERVEKLKQLWAEGHSSSKIADMLGDGISRCAVLGKVHRLGLPPRVAGRPKRRSDKPLPETKPMPFSREPVNITLSEIGERECRWPTERRNGEWLFCGHQTQVGCSYCPGHTLMAWTRTMPQTQRAEELERKAKARKEAEAAKRVSGDTWGWRNAG